MINKSVSAITICFIVTLFAVPSLAQVTPADQQRALDKLQETQQKQENLIKYLGREYERKEREKAKAQIEVPKPEEKEIPEGQCFDVKTIELKDATILSEKEKNKLIAPHLNSCMDIAAINQLMREITNYYFDKGYITTRVAVPQQDLNDGSLELLVVEGRIEEIILNENTWRDKLQVKTAFPFPHGKILNLRDIEQALDQFNRLLSSNATMQLEPGSKDGYSKIIITDDAQLKNRVSFGFNNSGQSSTGKNRATFIANHDNILGLGDYLSFGYNKDTADDGGELGNEVLSGQLAIPFGYWTLSGNVSHSEYRTTIRGTNQTFGSYGETTSGGFSLNRVLHRDQNSKTSATTGLTHKNTIAFIEGTEMPTGTRALSIARFSADHTHRVWNSILYGSLGYERGLDAFGAREDGSNLTYNNPRAQFDKFTIDTSVYKPFEVKKVNLAYRILASGQYSPDPLFSSEQLNIGDRYTVRGFQAESIAGDMGGYIRNEIIWDLPKPKSDKQYTETKFLHYVTKGFQSYVGTQAYAGLDLGWTRVRGGKLADPAGEAYVSGWTVGLRKNFGILQFDTAYSKQIKTPGFFTREDDELYFSVSTGIGF